MKHSIRLLAMLVFPPCYLAFGLITSAWIDTSTRRDLGAGLGDIGLMLLPSVLIYLMSLLFVRRAIRTLSTGETQRDRCSWHCSHRR